MEGGDRDVRDGRGGGDTEPKSLEDVKSAGRIAHLCEGENLERKGR